jgi:nucleoside-diphosphate-sugar epimerase
MRKPVTLITGAAGEIGHALIERLAANGSALATIDLQPLDAAMRPKVKRAFSGSILDRSLLESIQAEYAVDRVYHLAALLSTRSEFTPVTAHEVNVTGTLNLLEFAMAQARSQGRAVMFFYPSSIAAYGVPATAEAETGADADGDAGSRPLAEHEHNTPTTMYGCNKLYCEHLGRYYARHYRQLAVESEKKGVDFRSLRFPGLISAFTVPHGGTSDYGPEMIHAAAKGERYACFVRADTRIPFMAMPDAIDALLALMEAPPDRLSTHVYNVTAYSPSADEFAERVLDAFPAADIAFEPDLSRQAIVDSWPAEVDDSRARNDWGFAPTYDLARTFSEYLVPNIRKRYGLVPPE